jgi:hypothetical protein
MGTEYHNRFVRFIRNSMANFFTILDPLGDEWRLCGCYCRMSFVVVDEIGILATLKSGLSKTSSSSEAIS